MPGTPPTSSSFSRSITYSVVPPSTDPSKPANVLILLHSLGDTQAGFAELAKNLNLPETICISLCAPKPMPFDIPGYQWGEDVVFHGKDVSMDVKFDKAGFKTVNSVVEKLLEDGWKPREIFFFGWGQGAICVFDYLCRGGVNSDGMTREFGGLVSIGGIMGSEVKTIVTDEAKKSKTPILLCGGRKGLVTGKAEERVKGLFSDVEVVKFKKDGDGMIANQEEAMPVMR
ncbi:hypothetical protein ABW19_dt0200716 [Dactylella cylindrospora]|nr:hypothetical protein ABW19_dt0200716 [Dactylella cylindrospora]